MRNKDWFVAGFCFSWDYNIFMDKSKKDNKTILEINVNNSKKVKNWEKENRKAIDSYNQRVRENGLFSDGLRQF